MHEDITALLIELGAVILALGILGRIAARFGFSPLPLYLLAGLAFGHGGLLPLAASEEFVATGADSLAHRVLATLDRRQGQFANDMNPKNDNSHFQHLDETGAAAMQHWGERLDSWIGEVLLRAANIDHGSVESHKEERLHGAPTPLDQVPAAAPPAPLSLPPVAEMPPPAERKWTRHIGLAIAIAVLSVLVIAFAHIIARFPWLAVVLVLPWVLYMQQRK